MDSRIEAFGGQILGEIKTVLKGQYESYTDEEKALITACAKDAAVLTYRKLAGDDVAAEQKEVDAQLANIKVAGMGSFGSLLWGVVSKLLSVATSALLSRI